MTRRRTAACLIAALGKGIDVDRGVIDSVVDDEIREIFSVDALVTDAVDVDVDEKEEVVDVVTVAVVVADATVLFRFHSAD
ncbi:hypothetical protein NDU88_000234 [Pleurodeles waltl]|uniref:Uncharacterized protein n=1 Tax=Pleurodeles waltl TaxID=8319 RepID=A0AAV7LVQ5_PLEWA|nr:hypothetical protein NDU88_000234 [Pleurodeles waltl]